MPNVVECTSCGEMYDRDFNEVCPKCGEPYNEEAALEDSGRKAREEDYRLNEKYREDNDPHYLDDFEDISFDD